MNFLAEVLSSAEKIEIEEIGQKIPELEWKLDKLKIDLFQEIDNVYINYSSSGLPKKTVKLLTTIKNIEDEMKTLKKNAEIVTKKELVEANHNLTKQIHTLNTLNCTLEILSTVAKIDEKLKQFAKFMTANEFLNCRKIIDEVNDIFNDIPKDEGLVVIDHLRLKAKEYNNILLNKIRQCFQEKVTISQSGKCVILTISSTVEPLDQALLVMYYISSDNVTLKEFANCLWDNFFIPIVEQVVEMKVENNDNYSMLKLDIINSSEKPSYKNVFSHIKIVLQFLQTSFNFNLTDSDPKLSTVEYIGLKKGDNLSELIIKHCLVYTIPSTHEELKQYKSVNEDIKDLESSLKELKFFSEDKTSLLDYANNIDFHFINKKCEEYLLQSKQIMKKDLHDVTEVGEPYNPDKSFESKMGQFSQYAISKSVKELLSFCENILQQALKSSNMAAGRLFVTCQNILNNYTKFVPEYHNKLLKTIPQQVALFHNNCFYISHILSDWNSSYLSKMPSTLSLQTNGFEIEVNILRQVGSEIFLAYVKGQIQQINEIMKDSELHGATLEGDLKPITEKCIRQCLRQQEILKTVWHKVLSYKIYNETIGTILNSLCAALINPIVNFEDISLKSAEQLVEVIKIVISRGVKLFTDPKEVSLYVNLWYKLNELNFVLGASLLDINDRWADGKGPLALQFKPVELKSLIRALFQNTDRRAKILIKIQD